MTRPRTNCTAKEYTDLLEKHPRGLTTAQVASKLNLEFTTAKSGLLSMSQMKIISRDFPDKRAKYHAGMRFYPLNSKHVRTE